MPQIFLVIIKTPRRVVVEVSTGEVQRIEFFRRTKLRGMNIEEPCGGLLVFIFDSNTTVSFRPTMDVPRGMFATPPYGSATTPQLRYTVYRSSPTENTLDSFIPCFGMTTLGLFISGGQSNDTPMHEIARKDAYTLNFSKA
jgi:hypothetical protein